MVQNVGISNKTQNISRLSAQPYNPSGTAPALSAQYPFVLNRPLKSDFYALNSVNTKLTKEDEKKYLYLLEFLKDLPTSENSENMPPNKQLDVLLKNGKLLSKSNHDSSTTLDNLYLIATTKRKNGLDSRRLVMDCLDTLVNPRRVVQTFGNIPQQDKNAIINSLPENSEIRQNPDVMEVQSSGTCAAASIEVNVADKYPSEFVRWIEGLSSPKKAVYLNVDLNSISKNKLDAITILNLLKAQKVGLDFEKTKVKVNADDNAYIRADIQTHDWDKNERNVADVLIQSAIMNLGSQNTYNSLTDVRGGEFNSNPQGLIELEKTFVESLIKNKEISSLVYQQLDDEQNLIGYNCSFDKIAKHITDTIDSGDDVIMGYVLTNETSGRASAPGYNPQVDGQPNKVINGHEITIVDYSKDRDGKLVFTCIDTDDDNPQFVEYSAEWLLPKIHHAGYPAEIVAEDEEEIMKKVM